ncbi:MAG TPA: SRPBCC family protein [Amycolatopsis sp.]|nr:SRPBCC family protein [Amycolatopsis sp.]
MVTKQVKKATDKATDTASDVTGKATDTVSKATGAVPTELTDALKGLARTVGTRATTSLANGIVSTTGRLNDYAAGNGGGFLEALTGGKPGIKGQAAMGAVKGGMSGILDKVKGALGGGGGRKGDTLKVTNIVEEIDIGAPVDLVYDQWTRFSEFPKFMKKVENVEQTGDETTEWKAQIFWSHRMWEATILEQVPNERIIWRSEGEKGHVDGAVTFHDLTPDLTRVVLVLEYYPQGLFERTGNIWRAQGRRVRLELKHFRRHVMTEALLHPDDIEGWHGEIRDGKVVDGQDEDRGPEPEEAEDQDEEPAEYESAEETEDEEPAEEEPAEEEPEEEPERPVRRRRARATAGRE